MSDIDPHNPARILSVAIGDHVSSKRWRNTELTFDDLCSRLEETCRTHETVAEYAAMKGAKKLHAKDHGGFVGGRLKDGLRGASHVVSRSMLLTLDADHADLSLMARIVAGTDVDLVMYTTHGHTKDRPRFRIIVPLEEDVGPDAYDAVARIWASRWGRWAWKIWGMKCNDKEDPGLNPRA